MAATVTYIPPTAVCKIRIEADLTIEEATLLRALIGRTSYGYLDGLHSALKECPQVPTMHLPGTVPTFRYDELE